MLNLTNLCGFMAYTDAVSGGTGAGPGGGDPYWENVVLLMNGHEFDDDSSYNTTIVNNSANISDSHFVGDSNGFFETASHNANFTLFGVDNTIEFELYRTADTSVGAIIGKLRDNTGTSLTFWAWLISMGVGSNLTFQVGVSNIITTSLPTHGQWNHLAFSFTLADRTLRYYLNGGLVASAIISEGWEDAESPIGIMAEDASGGVPRLGYGTGDCYLRSLRITKGVARYTTDFVVPTTPFPNS